jgi:hypothetical protein
MLHATLATFDIAGLDHPGPVSASFESAALSRASRQQTGAAGSDGFELQSCALLGASCAPPQPGPGLQPPPAAEQLLPGLADDPHATSTSATKSARVAEPVRRRLDMAHCTPSGSRRSGADVLSREA